MSWEGVHPLPMGWVYIVIPPDFRMTTFLQMAIADAVLHHLVERVKSKTLFITHYPLVATDLERKFPEEVQNLHMSYTTDTRVNGTRNVTFLYQLTPGVTLESFGVECGRLAGLPH